MDQITQPTSKMKRKREKDLIYKEYFHTQTPRDDVHAEQQQSHSKRIKIDQFPCNTHDNLQLGTSFENNEWQGDGDDSFRLDIRSWCAKNSCVSVNAKADLLRIINKRHSDVPSDPRSLMKTPQNIKVVEISGGKYVHFGIENELREYFQTLSLNLERVTIDTHIDGLDGGKSSKTGYWSILGGIRETNYVFPIGLFEGSSKPKDVNEFLRPMVDEFLELIGSGFLVSGERKIECKCGISVEDLPAKSLDLNVKNCTGFSSCVQCHVIGVTFDLYNARSFPGTWFPPRTDAEFRAKSSYLHASHPLHAKLSYHNSKEPIEFERLHTNIPQQHPPDYMHSTVLGVQKKHTETITSIPHLEAEIDSRIKMIRKPEEIARLPGILEHLAKYKATEHRAWLIYIGTGLLIGLISNEIYLHWVKLHHAMRILLSPYNEDNPYDLAHELLRQFVEHWPVIFPMNPVSMNVHLLLHLAEAVKFHKCNLDDLSAFKFESYLKKIKNAYHGGRYKLQQVSYHTNDNYTLLSKRNSTFVSPLILGPILCSRWSSLTFYFWFSFMA